MLTIAGSDSGGGAGIVADVRTLTAHRVWPAVALAAVTAQDSVAVKRVEPLDADLVRAQVEAVMGDLAPSAVKTGMLGTGSTVDAVAAVLARWRPPLVVDPVIMSSTGARLLAPEAVDALRDRLLPLATLVTPNVDEAGALTDRPVASRPAMEEAGRALVRLGCGAALVTGGHLGGRTVADCLVVGSAPAVWLEAERVDRSTLHGTGCVLSAAIAARLALGDSLGESCRGAKAFVGRAIAAGVALGSGSGSVDPAGAR